MARIGEQTHQNLLGARILKGIFEIHADQMTSQPPVVLLIDSVKDQIHEVEPRQERWGQVDVLGDRQVGVVFTSDRIGRGQNTGPSVQSGDDSGFGDRYGLLLHDFVKHRSRGVGHLIELIDAADSTIRQHERAGFEDHLPRFGIPTDVGG